MCMNEQSLQTGPSSVILIRRRVNPTIEFDPVANVAIIQNLPKLVEMSGNNNNWQTCLRRELYDFHIQNGIV